MVFVPSLTNLSNDSKGVKHDREVSVEAAVSQGMRGISGGEERLAAAGKGIISIKGM